MKKVSGLGRGLSALIDDSAHIKTEGPSTSAGDVRTIDVGRIRPNPAQPRQIFNEEALAELASPVLHVDRSDPPLFLLHGDRDPQMPINQAHQLEGAYKALGLDVALDVVHGAGHGGAAFYAPAHLDRAVAFLRRTIGG